ncbi:MAG: zf-HC2 domain-containing protein [Candidatus Wallbacteria bacterium]|nr:zf-HC2 domain-containing protein [Candidatus Wallbacteria bacterium]
MPSCEKYEDLLQQYLDKALDSAQTAVLMSHIEVCSRCRLDFKLYSKIVAGLEEMQDLTPPGRLTSDVMAQVEGLPGFDAYVQSRQPAPWFWGLSAAMAGAIAVAGFLMLRAGSPTAVINPPMIAQQDQLPVLPAPISNIDMDSSPRAAGQRIVLNVGGGQVQVQKANSTKWQLASAPTDLGFGDKIRTLDGATAHIEYTQDKTTLKLRPSSLVQILANAVRVFHGDTWIRVDKIGSHFQAETPNAVASVHGTRYSAEVHYPEKIASFYKGDLDENKVARKFLDQYTKNLSDSRMNGLFPMMAYPMHATPVSLAVQVNMLLDALDATKTVQTNVQVFQSTVNVASIDPATNREISNVIVKEGHQTSVKNMQLAKLTPMAEDDFVKWGLPVDSKLLARVGEEVSKPINEAGMTLTPAGVRQVPASDSTGMKIEAEGRGNPGYDGVERRQ